MAYEWAFGIYNLYNRYNPYIIYFVDDDTKPSGTAAIALRNRTIGFLHSEILTYDYK